MSYPYIFSDNKAKPHSFDSSLRKLQSPCARFTQDACASSKIVVHVQALIKTMNLRTLLPFRILSVMMWLSFVDVSETAVSRMKVIMNDGADG